jgi:hypothetical protein
VSLPLPCLCRQAGLWQKIKLTHYQSRVLLMAYLKMVQGATFQRIVEPGNAFSFWRVLTVRLFDKSLITVS